MSAEEPKRPGPGRPVATETRERITLAALEQFAARGVDATSVQRVAEAAGLSKQALMHHYPTKIALRQAVYDRLAEAWDGLFDAVQPALLSLDEAEYRDLIEQMQALFDARSDVTRFLVRELLDRPDETTGWLLEHGRRWLEAFAELEERGPQEGDPADAPVDAEATATVAATLLLSLSALVSPARPGSSELQRFRERVARASRRVLARGLDLDRLPPRT